MIESSDASRWLLKGRRQLVSVKFVISASTSMFILSLGDPCLMDSFVEIFIMSIDNVLPRSSDCPNRSLSAAEWHTEGRRYNTHEVQVHPFSS